MLREELTSRRSRLLSHDLTCIATSSFSASWTIRHHALFRMARSFNGMRAPGAFPLRKTIATVLRLISSAILQRKEMKVRSLHVDLDLRVTENFNTLPYCGNITLQEKK